MAPGNDAPELADEDMLRLLQSLEIGFSSELSKVAAAYAAGALEDGSPQSFNEQIAEGWARVIWGRVRVPREVNFALSRSNRQTDAMKLVLERQYVQQIRLARPEGLSAELVGIGQALEAGTMEPHRLNCRSPSWVAARLWDRPAPFDDDSLNLRRWVDLWNLLSPQTFVTRKIWGGHDAQRFRQTALHLLQNDPSLEGWNETRDRFLRELAIIHGRTVAQVESSLPPLPDTLVDRVQWLDDNRVSRLSHESWMDRGDLLLLLSLLAADLDAAIFSPVFPMSSEGFVDLVIARPDTLFYLTAILPGYPRILADLLLDSRTTALACWLISQWRIGTSAFDRETVTTGDERARLEAFEDAVALLGWQLMKGASAAAEAGALLASLHRKAPAGFIDDLNGEEPYAFCSAMGWLVRLPEPLRQWLRRSWPGATVSGEWARALPRRSN